jgi:TRAP-type mannitol/chloroaromatic compound transport system substrate-binding protein
LLQSGGAVGAAAALAVPAIAQSAPALKWRLATSWPKSLDTLYGGAERFAAFVADATDDKFQIECFPAGAIHGVSGLQVTEAVSAGTVDLCHTAPYYMWAKDPTFALAGAVPFGLNGRMQSAWWREGGGERLINAFYEKQNIYGLLAGNTMAQMGGWFRKEIVSAEDLSGVRMRIGGFAGTVMQRLGVVPFQLLGGEILPAFEKGTILTTTRSSGCRRWPSTTTTPGGGRAAPCCTFRSTRPSGMRCQAPTSRSWRLPQPRPAPL